jgi:hypothetical protein
VRISNEVQYGAAPGTIHARKQNVAVQGRTEAGLFVYGSVERVHAEGVGGGALSQMPFEQVDFVGAYITMRCIEQAIEVVDFDVVEVDERDVFESCASE